MLLENISPVFGRHEKFAFRHSWLKKGVEATIDNPTIFTSNQSLIELGVGKNMVRSIRHWCQAVGLLDEIESKGRGVGLAPTELANNLILSSGWDPYLENTGTLWLIHWQLISNPVQALVWHLTFTNYLEVEFTKAQLTNYISHQFGRMKIQTTAKSIIKEIDCCIRSYVTSWSKTGQLSQESLDCPLTELNLIRFLQEDNIYRFNIGPKHSLPHQIFGYALLIYLSNVMGNRKSISVEQCIYQPGSPGQAFKLDENSATEYIESLETLTSGKVQLQESAGLKQIYIDDATEESLSAMALDMLAQFYE